MATHPSNLPPTAAELDMLMDRIRAAFSAQHEAGYKTGAWAHGSQSVTEAERTEARTDADQKVVLAWNELYNVLGAYGAAYADAVA